ncbi:MAG: cystathionine gamma-synthase [Sulfobacillus acidophilus]|uniref:Cystathionine gamma-synthase n=1 Tax=Sulfobacillus acidophilus TaxID=53633 RepID=A0A2T2WI23_9FIRM|nr:MAG: cystathionine gamma-synthase [Sulfobacillus acidophilus]
MVVHIGVGQDPLYGSVSTPIYQTVTYQHRGGELGRYDYSRTENPTRTGLQDGLAQLEGGAGASVFASGMAAIVALFHLLQQGDHVILTEDLYGGTYRVLVDVFQNFGLTATFVNTADATQVAEAIRPNTRLLFIETPSNPHLFITDLAKMATLAQTHHFWLAVDNTFMTPLRQRPLALGADFVVYSATKYLSGHNDVLAGALIMRDPDMAQKVAALANATGGVLAPFDTWLVMRGLKTLAVRLDRQEDNARAIAGFLQEHPAVTDVYYPGLTTHPGFETHRGQSGGPGAMVSFQLKASQRQAEFMDALHLILPAVSLGGTESLITHPYTETHRELPDHVLSHLGIGPGLLRLSVGLEYVDDLIADLDQALTRVKGL